ncbi:restriction endonuclease subunit S [Riemerella anatipestifer]|nr:restriction endonuclease subunit S [Riemerella anatipestifer]
MTLVEENIQKLKQLNESVLDVVFKNKPKNWKTDCLKKLTTKIGSGSTPTGGQNSYKESGISLIRSLNVHNWGFKEKNLAFIDEVQAKKLSNVEIENNDVLLNITGASVARCCIVPENIIPARVNQHVSILRIKKELLLPKFLHYSLISPFYKNQLLYNSSGGATREALSKSMLEKFEINYPTIIEQQHIVAYLDQTTKKN